MKASRVWEGESNFLSQGVVRVVGMGRYRGTSYCSKPEQ